MGLIVCPDCAGKVSDLADACPHCGRPTKDITAEKPLNVEKGRVTSPASKALSCPYCQQQTVVPKAGMVGNEGSIFFLLLALGSVPAFLVYRGENATVDYVNLLAYLAFGWVPGFIYYLAKSKKPYCTHCDTRV